MYVAALCDACRKCAEAFSGERYLQMKLDQHFLKTALYLRCTSGSPCNERGFFAASSHGEG